jgi:hypothetical protein
MLCKQSDYSRRILPLQHTRLQNPNLIQWPILLPRLNQPHPLHNTHPPRHPPKNRMLAIQPRRWRQRNEKLTPIRIWSTIRHTQNTRPGMLQGGGNLVFEFLAVDGCSATPGPCGIAGLQHEIGDYAVEDYTVVITAFGEGAEVFAGLALLVVDGKVGEGHTFGAWV